MTMSVGAIWYGPFARFADWYHGWRDGRAVIPDRDHGVAATQHQDMLIRRARDAFEHERVQMEARRHSAESWLADVCERHRHASRRLVDAQRQLAATPSAPNATELTMRRYGEQRHGMVLVRSRRIREHRRRHRQAAAAVERAQGALDRINRERALAQTAVDREIVVARARVRRIQEHTHRRLAAYRRKLVRVHPEGGWVNEVMDSVHPLLPGWVLGVADNQPLQPEWRVAAKPPGTPAVTPVQGHLFSIGESTRFGAERTRVDVWVRSGYGVAGLHATLKRRGDGYRLYDHNRGEGTFHDGEPLRWADLAVGGRFTIGDYQYRIVELGVLEEILLGPCDLVVSNANATSRNPRTKQPEPRLTQMSFTQRASTLLAVLGPSGAGKSSLFSAVLGELQLGTGSLYFSRMDIRHHPAQLRPKLGFVPQEEHLPRSLTVRQVLTFSDRLRRPRDRARGRPDRVVRVCTELGIAHKLDQPVATLSGGQRKRVSIALEILAEPSLLMLDEPTSGLDPAKDKEVMQILAGRAAQGCTVIVVTHSTQHLQVAHQVLVVAPEGCPVYLGSPEAVLPELDVGDYAELMSRLSTDSSADVATYQSSEAVTQASAMATALREEVRSTAPPRRRRDRGLGPSFLQQLLVLAHRQLVLVLTRAPVRHAETITKRVLGIAVVAMPLIVAAVGTVLAAMVAGDDGLAGGVSAPTALSLLVTLIMLGAQALTYSDVVSDYPMIHREHRTGTRPAAVVLSK
ncbi:MAG: ATP-binding cassette domain-containing protein, partial [Pseudonocardiaceae bacterium]